MLVPRRGFFATLLGCFTPTAKKQTVEFLHVMQVNYYDLDEFTLMTASKCVDLHEELRTFHLFNSIHFQWLDTPKIAVRRGKFIIHTFDFPTHTNLRPETLRQHDESLKMLSDKILSACVFEIGDILEIAHPQKHCGSSILVVTGLV